MTKNENSNQIWVILYRCTEAYINRLLISLLDGLCGVCKPTIRLFNDWEKKIYPPCSYKCQGTPQAPFLLPQKWVKLPIDLHAPLRRYEDRDGDGACLDGWWLPSFHTPSQKRAQTFRWKSCRKPPVVLSVVVQSGIRAVEPVINSLTGQSSG